MVIKVHNPFDNHSEGLFAKITKELAIANDWLAGAPMTQRDRMNLTLVESERWQLPRGY